MSCFGGGVATATYYSSSSSSGVMSGRSGRPWRWWRAKCAGIAASVGSRLRRSIKGLDGRRRRRRRRRATTFSSVVLHHRRNQYSSFAPVYVDELYTHHQQQPSSKPFKLNAAAAVQEEPSTSGKLVDADATRASGKATAAAGVGAMKNILMRSPGRGGGVLGVAKGMGEVDLRAELFIRKFKEDMRLQSQRSAEEFQAMLARGL